MAQVTSSCVAPVMCGTSYLSLRIVTPSRGTLSLRAGPSGPTPKPSDLKSAAMSASVTLLPSGVSASYMSAWVSAPGGGGLDPYWPPGENVARGRRVILRGGRRSGQHQCRRSYSHDPGHPRNVFDA